MGEKGLAVVEIHMAYCDIRIGFMGMKHVPEALSSWFNAVCHCLDGLRDFSFELHILHIKFKRTVEKCIGMSHCCIVYNTNALDLPQ